MVFYGYINIGLAFTYLFFSTIPLFVILYLWSNRNSMVKWKMGTFWLQKWNRSSLSIQMNYYKITNPFIPNENDFLPNDS